MSEKKAPDSQIAGLGDERLGAKPERNLALWLARKEGRRWVDLARDYDLSVPRVRQIVEKIDMLTARAARKTCQQTANSQQTDPGATPKA